MSTFVLKPGGAVGQDCSLLSGSPTTNFGATNILYIGTQNTDTDVETARALIRFTELTTIIPKFRKVSSAILSLYLTQDFSGSVSNVDIHRSLRAWVEAEATYNIWKTGSNWTSGGGRGIGTDREEALLGTRAMSASEADGWKHWSLNTDLIFEIINGLFTNNGFWLQSRENSDDLYTYRSSDYATATYNPYLTIVIDDSVGGSMAII